MLAATQINGRGACLGARYEAPACASSTQVAGGQPIAWAPTADPLSIVGYEEWTDYAVAVTAVFSAAPPGSDSSQPPARWGLRSPARSGPASRHRGAAAAAAPRSNSAPLYVETCDPTSGAQIFALNTTSGWVSSSWGPGGAGCLTSCGCDPSCIQMCTSRPSSVGMGGRVCPPTLHPLSFLADICGNGGCGAPGQSYDWSLSADGAFSAAAYPGLGLTVNSNDIVTLAPLPASGPPLPSQTWTYDSSTGLLSAHALGVCLSQQRPSRTYAAVCGRIGAYNGFNAVTTPGYCACGVQRGLVFERAHSPGPALQASLSFPRARGGSTPTAPHSRPGTRLGVVPLSPQSVARRSTRRLPTASRSAWRGQSSTRGLTARSWRA